MNDLLLLDGESSKRINFRTICEVDFDQWLPFFEDPNTSKHWKFAPQPPIQCCQNWYKKQFHRYANGLGGMNALIEKTSGSLVGHCGLLIQSVDGITEVEIGYSLLPKFWGLGFAIEAAQKCRDYAFQNNFADSLISIISLTNIPSEKVAYANGMLIDKQTQYDFIDVNIFRIKRTDWQAKL
ncbi:MAG: GNAT family N-acetyltransferase [Marinicella sp.]